MVISIGILGSSVLIAVVLVGVFVLMVIRVVLAVVVLIAVVLVDVFVLIVIVVVLIVVVLIVVVLIVSGNVVSGNVDTEFADDVLAQDHKGCAHARFEGDPVAVDIDDVPDNPTGGEYLVPDFELFDELLLVLCLHALRAENQKVEPSGDHNQDQQRRTRSTRLLGCRGGECGQGRGQSREDGHHRAIGRRELVHTAVRL